MIEKLKKQIWGVPVWGIILIVIVVTVSTFNKEDSTNNIDYSDRHTCSVCGRNYNGKGYEYVPMGVGCTKTSSGTKCSVKCCKDSR
jgi:hypothetical protein